MSNRHRFRPLLKPRPTQRCNCVPDAEVIRGPALFALVGLMVQVEDEVIGERAVALLPGDARPTTALPRLLVADRRDGAADVATAILATEQVAVCPTRVGKRKG